MTDFFDNIRQKSILSLFSVLSFGALISGLLLCFSGVPTQDKNIYLMVANEYASQQMAKSVSDNDIILSTLE